MSRFIFFLVSFHFFIISETTFSQATLVLTSSIGSDNQTICTNTAIETIQYTMGGDATSLVLSGTLPSGVNAVYSSGVYTISGSTISLGNHTFSISTVGGTTIATASGSIFVNTPIVPYFYLQSISICQGVVAPILPSGSLNNPPVTGAWTPSVVDVNTTGTYTFIPDIGQCAQSVTRIVTVDPNPILVITNPAPVCAPFEIDLTNPSITYGSSGCSLSYWTNPACTDSVLYPQSVADSGIYFVRSVNAYGCCTIMPINIIIHSVPHSINEVIVNQHIEPFVPEVCNGSITFDALNCVTLYFLNNSTIASSVNTLDSLCEGTYTIVLTSEHGCIDTTIFHIGLDDPFIDGMIVFQNIEQQELTISVQNFGQNEFSIFNATGENYFNLETNEKSVNVSTCNLPSGQYFVSVKTGGETYKKHIFIE